VGRAPRGRQLADGRTDPGARDQGPPRNQGPARGRPRALQHPGRHDHAVAGTPAPRDRCGRMGRLAIRGRRPRRQASRQGTREPEYFPWRTTMIVPNLHKEPTARDTVLHRDLKLNTTFTAIHLLQPFTSFMVTLSEFAEASRDFPI